MAFIDEIKFHGQAGDGGMGVVRWRHLKGKQFSGAAGGNGGKGGDVLVRATRDLSILSRHKSVKKFVAGKGGAGQADSRHGKNGEDKVIDLPIGSVVTNLSTGRTVELLVDGQTELILHGGSGGLGNEYFKASTNVKPEQSTRGRTGESAEFTVELNLIADAGLVGLPNAGKSSLLNALTNADAKVGSYAFTTLDPNLGAIRGYVIADIPGLIEGASEGKGLGHKFLRHIKRTKMILHLISLENEDIESAYFVIRRELQRYGRGLPEKRETIILTKTDQVDARAIRTARDILKKHDKDILEVSVLDDRAVKKLAEAIVRRLQKE
ncbi:MAG: GTPase [Candidatus Parcubacteria bacterium]|jgi:GTP-binding protein|nr:GTPase [Candidatus Parcubacteria bacterium]